MMKSHLTFFLKLLDSKRQGALLLFSAFLCFLSALMEGFSYSFLVVALSALFKQTLPMPFALLTKFLGSHLFTFSILASVLSQVLKSGLCFGAATLNATLGMRLQTKAQLEIYNKIFHFDYTTLHHSKTGELVEYVRAPLLFFRPFLEHGGAFLISCALILVSTVFLSIISWKLTLVVVALFFLALMLQKKIVRKNMKLSHLLQGTLEKFSAYAVQSFSGIKLIHLYNSQNFIKKRMEWRLKKFEKASSQLLINQSLMLSLNEIFGVLFVAAALLLGWLILTLEGGEVLLKLVAFMTITYRLSGKVLGAVQSFNHLVPLSAPYNQMRGILENQSERFPKRENVGRVEEIVFDNLTFTYTDRNDPSLIDFTHTLERGTQLALVGGVGAGKSTVIDLLSGLYLPTSGSIFIDGVPLQEIDLKAWREKLGVVSQDVTIFNESVEENIGFGKEGATFEEIVKAAQEALCHDFIMKLPQGYKTRLGERGLNLSGGERQKIALARALVRQSEILLLDEVTSHLDAKSALWIQEFLALQRGKRTIILIAHNLSMITHVDMIITLDRGKTMEKGSHQTLLQKKGLYAYLWSLQNQDILCSQEHFSAAVN